jgi:SHS2 domain-containing protein
MAVVFRFLEDIALADLAFEAEGDSLEELFLGGTRALMESLANPSTVHGTWKKAITRSDADVATLFFDWLCDLVYWKDAAGVVYHDVQLTLARRGNEWTLQARLSGAPVDPRTQELRTDVKGVTKHLYALTEAGGHWKVRVVLDV